MDPIQNIRLNETNFTKSEIKIMNYLLDHIDDVANHSLVSFSEAIGTSKSALLRFTQKIGYDGYSEFKYDISNYAITKERLEQRSEKTASIAQTYSDTIQKLDITLDPDGLLKMKEMIINANKIKLFGIAETGLTAEFFRYRLNYYGYDAETITQLNLIERKASMSSKDDLHIVFSLSANTEAIVEVVKESSRGKVPTILISQNDRTPLKEKVDLFCLLPFFEYTEKNNIILDSQVIIHAFIGIFLNVLLTDEETKND